MSSPFSSITPKGTFTWVLVPTIAGNFSPVTAIGVVSIPEVGFGEGGFGEDGFDTPAIIVQGASEPIWSTGSPR